MQMAAGISTSLRQQCRTGDVDEPPRRSGGTAALHLRRQPALAPHDEAGQPMALDLPSHPRARRCPSALDLRRKIICFGQDDTYSYFQTGMAMSGTLQWGELRGRGQRQRGHVDRQWFPNMPAAGAPGRSACQVARVADDQPRQRRRHEYLAAVRPDGRQCAATVFGCDGELPRPDDGSGMRGGRRSHRQQLRPMAESTSYRWCRRWPSAQVHARPAPAALCQFATRSHRRAFGGGPGARLPIEYMEGPYRYRGTMRGEPVSGFAFYERSLALPGLGAGRRAGGDRRESQPADPGSGRAWSVRCGRCSSEVNGQKRRKLLQARIRVAYGQCGVRMSSRR